MSDWFNILHLYLHAPAPENASLKLNLDYTSAFDVGLDCRHGSWFMPVPQVIQFTLFDLDCLTKFHNLNPMDMACGEETSRSSSRIFARSAGSP
jgi:hypothetical protein